MPRVSVVIAAYNAERELGVLLESLCASDLQDFEVCVCDDGSRDRTAAVAQGFAARLDLKLVRHPENRGVTAARNSAWSLAGAPLLWFLDADVRVYPDTLDKLLARLEASGADVVEGIYSDIALDPGLLPEYYALFVHHSFLGAPGPVPYNVFNAWCALCRREAIAGVGGHQVVPRGVEIENETLGRRLAARGYTVLLDPGVAVDHHWRGLRKLLFIFTRRVYWWVKVFFASDQRFEVALTTRGYALGTLCVPAAALAASAAVFHPTAAAAAAAFLAGFLLAYGPFLVFVWRWRGAGFCAMSLLLSAAFAPLISASALYSAAEEAARRLLLGRTTLDPEAFAA